MVTWIGLVLEVAKTYETYVTNETYGIKNKFLNPIMVVDLAQPHVL